MENKLKFVIYHDKDRLCGRKRQIENHDGKTNKTQGWFILPRYHYTILSDAVATLSVFCVWVELVQFFPETMGAVFSGQNNHDIL